MSLQGNGNNHNYRPDLNDENDSFLKFDDSEEYSKITGQTPSSVETDGSVAFGSSEEERKKKLQEAIDRENSSAYDDLDDFVYKQNKRRARTSGHRHHHSHISPSVLSPGRAKRSAKNSKKKHRHKHHYHRHHRRRRLRRWQKIALGIIISLICLIAIMSGVIVYMYYSGIDTLVDDSGLNINPPGYVDATKDGRVITYKGHYYQYNKRIANILCMGSDRDAEATRINEAGDDFATGGQADSLFLTSVNVDTGIVNLVNISRETMAEVNVYTSNGKAAGSRNEQICLAYAYGDGEETSCQNELVAVRRLFYNLPINFYMSLNINGIAPINDSIGGVNVTSPETIAEFNKGETYHLQGSLAQSFVRARSHETFKGNSMRMERQKIYLEAFSRDLFALTRSNFLTPLDLYNTSDPYITTNIGSKEVAYFAVTALRGEFNGINVKNVPGEVKEGKKFAEFYVDEKKFFELFLELFYKKIE